MSSPVPLRTSSLSRRVVLGSLAVLLVVLAAAGVLTDVLLGAQLRADAAARLNTRVADAQTALDSGAQPREVVAAAQGDGVTAALLTADGKVVGNVKVKPAPGGRVPPGHPREPRTSRSAAPMPNSSRSDSPTARCSPSRWTPRGSTTSAPSCGRC